VKSTLLALCACLLCVTAASGAPPQVTVHAVMFELTYNAQTLEVTHAQVVGGYPSVDACKEAMPKVVAVGAPQLDQGEQMQLECSGIRSGTELESPPSAGAPDEGPPKPKVSI
jgi:hypothetical protein